MSRYLTNRNHNHPHYQLKDFLQEQKKKLSALSTAALRGMCMKEASAGHIIFPMHTLDTLPRHKLIEVFLEACEKGWKEKWKTECGFDFDDIYDGKKMKEHRARWQEEERAKMRERAAGPKVEDETPAPFDARDDVDDEADLYRQELENEETKTETTEAASDPIVADSDPQALVETDDSKSAQ